MIHYEELAQKEVAAWLKSQNVFFTASAGGMRTSIGTANKMKAMGYLRGCPDLLIFEPKGTFKALFVEMKRAEIRSLMIPKGSISEYQKEFKKQALLRGYLYLTCYGSDDAITQISLYLDEKF